jgi:hypothetical protein
VPLHLASLLGPDLLFPLGNGGLIVVRHGERLG